MKKQRLPASTLFVGIIIYCITVFSSCAPVKNVVYFENMKRDTTLYNLVNQNLELKIRKNDLLSINIVSPDPVTTPLFNGFQNSSTTASSGAGATGGGANTGGFLVDRNGSIFLYKLGSVRVEGLTRNELKLKLEKELAPYLKDVVITIRFLNNYVTVLGEVNRPQVLNMPNEELTLLQAIGQSGDLTLTGRRDNILVVRETTTGKQFKRINLNDNSIFYSPFYYLKPDDVVYIEPTKYKINNTTQKAQNVNYLLSGVTILITIITLLRN